MSGGDEGIKNRYSPSLSTIAALYYRKKLWVNRANELSSHSEDGTDNVPKQI